MIDWNEIQKALLPIKNFDDLQRRFRVSLGYPFVRQAFNFTMPELATYTQRGVGSDSRSRYDQFASRMIGILTELDHAGVQNVIELAAHIETREKLESFVEQSGIDALEIIAVLKYLIYWFIPGEKYLSGLVRSSPAAAAAIQALRGIGVRTNLELIQRGLTPAGRLALAEASGLPIEVTTEWVHRADLSRMPWASKATIANIMGAGYGSLARLANADPEQLYADFFRYGKSIGKNLKLGNEIENSHRIAKILPILIQEE